jgi:hypothetical protein
MLRAFLRHPFRVDVLDGWEHDIYPSLISTSQIMLIELCSSEGADAQSDPQQMTRNYYSRLGTGQWL